MSFKRVIGNYMWDVFVTQCILSYVILLVTQNTV